MQSVRSELVASSQGSLGAAPQNCLSTTIMSTFYGKGEIRRSDEPGPIILVHVLINKSLLQTKAPESGKESM